MVAALVPARMSAIREFYTWLSLLEILMLFISLGTQFNRYNPEASFETISQRVNVGQLAELGESSAECTEPCLD
jgi:hypothetical protein